MLANESYDENLFLRPQNINLKCPICFNIMKNPVQCPFEGHNFCRQCILKHLDQSETCPTCREPLEKEQLVPNRGLDSIIEDAEVHCLSYSTRSSQGIETRKRSNEEAFESCDWSGKLKDAEGHYNQCQFAKINCPHTGCEDVFLRNFLPIHIEVCLHRLILCEWCNLEQKVDVSNGHLLVCPQRPLPCPNGCVDENGAAKVCSASEVAHHRTICTKELIGCKFNVAGCQIKLLRQDMPQHEDDIGAHIGGLLDALQTAQAENKLAREQIGELTQVSEAQGKCIKNLMGDRHSVSFDFNVPITRLDEVISSTTSGIDQYEFLLILRPSKKPAHLGFHSLHLHLLENKNFNPVYVEAEFELVSYSNLYPARGNFFSHIFCGAEVYGYDGYIKSSILKHERYAKDGEITIKAKLKIKTN